MCIAIAAYFILNDGTSAAGGGGLSCDGQQTASIRVFTKEQLLEFDGVRNPKNPLYLVVLGEVFDVTSGEKHYRPQPGQETGGYAVFLGKDSSRAFHDGKFDRSVEDVRDLNPTASLDLDQWRTFYRTHKAYPQAGLAEGLYYDCNGKPTAALREVEDLFVAGRQASEVEENLKKKYKGCDSQFTAASGISNMWCTDPQHVPRIMKWTHAGTGAESQRCACFTQELMQTLPPHASLVEYANCAPDASKCSLKL